MSKDRTRKRAFWMEPWKPRKTADLVRSFSVSGAELAKLQFPKLRTRNGERCDMWHFERTSTQVRACGCRRWKTRGRDKIRKVRSAREEKKKMDLTGGSGRRKSIILGRSTGKILCLWRLILRYAGNLLHAGECRNALPSVRIMSRYLGRHDVLQPRSTHITWINLLRFTSTNVPGW